jgi:hypothetical protein
MRREAPAVAGVPLGVRAANRSGSKHVLTQRGRGLFCAGPGRHMQAQSRGMKA